MMWSGITLVLCINLPLLVIAKSDNPNSPIVDPISNVTAYVGDNVTVTCKAHSEAISQVQWLIYNKENKNMTVLRSKLEEYEYLIPSGKDIAYGGKLFLPNVSFEDQMKYTCLVGNQTIGYGRRSFFLRVLPRIHTVEKSLKFRQTFQNATAEIKKGIKLICQVKGPKDSQYWWLKDGKNIDTTKKRFKYKHFRYLKIRKVGKSDAGNYTCVASRNNFTIKHTMYLYVSVPNPKPTEFPKDFLITSPVMKKIQNITAYNGDSVTVLCQAYSYVLPEFAWLIYDKVHKNMSALKPRIKEHEYLPPTSSDRRLHGFKLFLPSVSFEDQREYTCLAANQFGYDYKSFFLYVLRGRPERLMADPVVQQINNVTAYVGDNVTVTCKAYSDAIPHFQWLIYNKENNNMTVLRPKLKEYEYLIPPGKDKFHGVKLFLPNVSFEDEKEYTCLVGNHIGYDHRSFFLHVLPRIHTSASVSQSAVIKDNSESFRKVLIIVPIVAFCVLILVVSLMWVFSVFRKRQSDDASLRHSVDDVGKGYLSAAETKITTKI